MGGLWSRRIIGAVGVLILGVMGNYAYAALQDSTLPFGDAVAVLIWPIAMVSVAGIIIAVIAGERPTTVALAPSAESSPEAAPEPESADVSAARTRLAQLEDQDRRIKLRGLLNVLDQEIRHAGELIANYGPTGSDDVDLGWSRTNEWQGSVERVLGDSLWPVSTDLVDFRRNVDSMLTDVAGRDRLARYLTIKRQLLQTIYDNRLI